MNQKNSQKFKDYCMNHRFELLNSSTIKSGAGRSVEVKEDNYSEVKDILASLGITNKTDIPDAVKILSTAIGRAVEVQEPPADSGVARKLGTLNADSSAVRDVINSASGAAIDVRLDNDQLKHQHPTIAIGTRHKGGGNRFKADYCSAAWHTANTMQHMADWAAGLTLTEGQQQFHGQATPVNEIHYEGSCLMANGAKYVLFHCYPADGSDMKL